MRWKEIVGGWDILLEVLVTEMNSGAPDKTCFFSFAFLARRVNRSKTTLMEYYPAIKKNGFESVLMRRMKLEPIIQNEVSQKEKYQYNILMDIYGI